MQNFSETTPTTFTELMTSSATSPVRRKPASFSLWRNYDIIGHDVIARLSSHFFWVSYFQDWQLQDPSGSQLSNWIQLVTPISRSKKIFPPPVTCTPRRTNFRPWLVWSSNTIQLIETAEFLFVLLLLRSLLFNYLKNIYDCLLSDPQSWETNTDRTQVAKQNL